MKPTTEELIKEYREGYCNEEDCLFCCDRKARLQGRLDVLKDFNYCPFSNCNFNKGESPCRLDTEIAKIKEVLK